jgi:hypothetical protein
LTVCGSAQRRLSFAVRGHKNVISSAEEFVKLRDSEDPTEYQRAANEEAPDEVWLDVIRNHPEMRVWVVHNKTVPLAVLDLLSRDTDAEVRSAVATKRKLTRSLRALLARDEDASVRVRVVYNAKCEPEILHLLATDPEIFVREAARKRLLERTDAL